MAEWMGTKVAAKELLCLADRAKDDVERKRMERRADGGEPACDSGDSDRCAAPAVGQRAAVSQLAVCRAACDGRCMPTARPAVHASNNALRLWPC